MKIVVMTSSMMTMMMTGSVMQFNSVHRPTCVRNYDLSQCGFVAVAPLRAIMTT